MFKSYSELIKLESFNDRLKYLMTNGNVSDITFGCYRYLNQKFYNSYKWKRIRREIILRDNGCDLAHEDHPVYKNVFIHHINPITVDDLLNERSLIFDPENLISCSQKTHNQIHYGDAGFEKKEVPYVIERKEYDTCPWR